MHGTGCPGFGAQRARWVWLGPELRETKQKTKMRCTFLYGAPSDDNRPGHASIPRTTRPRAKPASHGQMPQLSSSSLVCDAARSVGAGAEARFGVGAAAGLVCSRGGLTGSA